MSRHSFKETMWVKAPSESRKHCLCFIQHHPDIAFDYNMVHLQVQTHRITKPTPLPDSAIHENASRGRLPPGLTLNDARLAINVEELFTNVYLADGRGRLHAQSNTANPATIHGINNIGHSLADITHIAQTTDTTGHHNI